MSTPAMRFPWRARRRQSARWKLVFDPAELRCRAIGESQHQFVSRTAQATRAPHVEHVHHDGVVPRAQQLGRHGVGRCSSPKPLAIELPGGDAEIQQDEIGPKRRHGAERLGRRVGRLEVADPLVAQPAGGSRRSPRGRGRCPAPRRLRAESASAWPPSPRVASTARRAPAAAAQHRSQQHRHVNGRAWRRSWSADGRKRNTPSAGTGWHAQQRERG